MQNDGACKVGAQGCMFSGGIFFALKNTPPEMHTFMFFCVLHILTLIFGSCCLNFFGTCHYCQNILFLDDSGSLALFEFLLWCAAGGVCCLGNRSLALRDFFGRFTHLLIHEIWQMFMLNRTQGLWSRGVQPVGTRKKAGWAWPKNFCSENFWKGGQNCQNFIFGVVFVFPPSDFGWKPSWI